MEEDKNALSRKIAFRKVVNAIEELGDDLDSVLLQDSATTAASPAAASPTATSEESRSIAGLSAQLLKEGLIWALEELQKPPGKTELRTVNERFRAFEFARKTYQPFLDLVKRDQKERTIRLDRERLLQELRERVEVYLETHQDLERGPMRRLKAQHDLARVVNAEVAQTDE